MSETSRYQNRSGAFCSTCGEAVNVYVSKKENNNKGRKFYKCESCKEFRWLGYAQTEDTTTEFNLPLKKRNVAEVTNDEIEKFKGIDGLLLLAECAALMSAQLKRTEEMNRNGKIIEEKLAYIEEQFLLQRTNPQPWNPFVNDDVPATVGQFQQAISNPNPFKQ
jgi:hypothetical protein